MSLLSADERQALQDAVSTWGQPGNDPRGHASMSDLWRSAKPGDRLPAAYVQRNWIPIKSLQGLVGEAFLGLNPPAFVVDGDPYVPSYDYEYFVGNVLAMEKEIRRRRQDDELDRDNKREIAARRRRLGKSVVYFIQDEAGGPIKIGFSCELKNRLASLQASHTGKLRVLATMRGAKGREAEMHKRFAGHRLRGEWFYPADELLAFIAELTP